MDLNKYILLTSPARGNPDLDPQND
ncbi:hypothetical protein A2U01_0074595, partial [Trifolium medium]|nr:hypothetical protein [Trifolium medium]